MSAEGLLSAPSCAGECCARGGLGTDARGAQPIAHNGHPTRHAPRAAPRARCGLSGVTAVAAIRSLSTTRSRGMASRSSPSLATTPGGRRLNGSRCAAQRVAHRLALLLTAPPPRPSCPLRMHVLRCPCSRTTWPASSRTARTTRLPTGTERTGDRARRRRRGRHVSCARAGGSRAPGAGQRAHWQDVVPRWVLERVSAGPCARAFPRAASADVACAARNRGNCWKTATKTELDGISGAAVFPCPPTERRRLDSNPPRLRRRGKCTTNVGREAVCVASHFVSSAQSPVHIASGACECPAVACATPGARFDNASTAARVGVL